MYKYKKLIFFILKDYWVLKTSIVTACSGIYNVEVKYDSSVKGRRVNRIILF